MYCNNKLKLSIIAVRSFNKIPYNTTKINLSYDHNDKLTCLIDVRN